MSLPILKCWKIEGHVLSCFEIMKIIETYIYYETDIEFLSKTLRKEDLKVTSFFHGKLSFIVTRDFYFEVKNAIRKYQAECNKMNV